MPRQDYKQFQAPIQRSNLGQNESAKETVHNYFNLDELNESSEDNLDTIHDNNLFLDVGSLYDKLEDVSDASIMTVMAAIMAHDSQTAFELRTFPLPEPAQSESRLLWEQLRLKGDSLYICCNCGNSVTRYSKCCGETAVFHRAPLHSQLNHIVSTNLSSILEVRGKMQNYPFHPLNAPIFKTVSQRDENRRLSLSLVASVDGVTPEGHTKKKLWPLSFLLVDMESYRSQLSENLILGGVIEATKNPSTHVWNKVFQVIMSEISNITVNTENYDVGFTVVTISADQPAKRSVFGMVGFNSAYGCLYCLSPDTFHKSLGPERYKIRAGPLTIEDSTTRNLGFGNTAPWIVNFIKPYEVPIDNLHTYCEGVAEIIIKDLFIKWSESDVIKPFFGIRNGEALKSFLKQVKIGKPHSNCWNLRNGSEKGMFLRVFLLPFALLSDNFSPGARFVVVGIVLILLKDSVPLETNRLFLKDLCESVAELMNERHDYFTIKLHEILYHADYTNNLLGNNSLLSTSTFESMYRNLLSDYNQSITVNFVEMTISRFIARKFFYREVRRRRMNPKCSENFKNFAKFIPEYIHASDQVSGKLKSVPSEESMTTNCHYGVVILKIGKLISHHHLPSTHSDCAFFTLDGKIRCGKFKNAGYINDTLYLCFQLFIQVPRGYEFMAFKMTILALSQSKKAAAHRILGHLYNYPGVCNGVLSNVHAFIPSGDMLSLASVTQEDDGRVILIAINGQEVHV